MRPALFALPLSLALTLPLTALLTQAAHAQESPVALTCVLNILCPHTGACRDLAQTIEITETNDDWTVVWVGTDLPSDYALIGDIPAPEGAVEATRVRSLIYSDTVTQTMQMVTFDTTGHVVVTTHQPQAGMQVVTGLGQCEAS